MSNHDDLIEEAERAINKVFGDTSVSRSTTRESLNGLIGFIEVALDAMATDEEHQ